MKQLLLTVCLTLAALTCSAQNAEAIEEKLNEYGRILNSKQNIYYFIGDDGKVTDVVMSSTIDYDMQQEKQNSSRTCLHSAAAPEETW